MAENKRFTGNGDGTVTDNDTGLVWCQVDSWGIAQEFLDFKEALAFVDNMNKQDYLGQHDWRIPEREEVEKLFVPECTLRGRSSQELHLDPAFAEGGGNGTWCLPFDQQAAFYFSYVSGIAQGYDQDFSHGYLRMVRLYPE